MNLARELLQNNNLTKIKNSEKIITEKNAQGKETPKTFYVMKYTPEITGSYTGSVSKPGTNITIENGVFNEGSKIINEAVGCKR